VTCVDGKILGNITRLKLSKLAQGLVKSLGNWRAFPSYESSAQERELKGIRGGRKTFEIHVNDDKQYVVCGLQYSRFTQNYIVLTITYLDS
jgi:hypothetical protein